MTDPCEFSDYFKTCLRFDLIEKLFEPDKRRLAKTLAELVLQNKHLTGTLVDGFRYNGMWFFSCNAGKLGKLSIVADTLEVEVDRYLQDKKLVDQDQDLIKQVLVRLLFDCKTEEHCRNALPECLIPLVAPRLNAYPRNDEPGYTLRDDQRSYRQFLKALPKMEMYSALGLFY